MRKVIVYIAMSLDGYIADQNHSVDFLNNGGNSDISGYQKFYNTIDTVVLGYTTYHQIMTELSPDVWPYEGKTSYVMTHKSMENKKDIVFTEHLSSLISSLKQQEGKDIWVCGGAKVIHALRHENLIDEYHVCVAPILLGKGISLFEEMDKSTHLSLVSVEKKQDMAELVYNVVKTEG